MSASDNLSTNCSGFLLRSSFAILAARTRHLISVARVAAFSVASRLSNSSDIILRASSEPPPPWVACCAHQVQNFNLSQRFWCRGLWGLGFNEQIFGADKQVPGRRQSDKEGFGPIVSPPLVQKRKGRIASDSALLNLPRP